MLPPPSDCARATLLLFSFLWWLWVGVLGGAGGAVYSPLYSVVPLNDEGSFLGL